MVAKNFQTALDKTLSYEGGWSDHPDDPGGATMKGITLSTYSAFLGRKASKDDLKNISNDDIRNIYQKNYWDKVSGDNLPNAMDVCVFDFAVNSGPSRAIRLLQGLSGATTDGIIGPKTVAAAREWVLAHGCETCIYDYQQSRLHYLQALPTFIVFGRGWTRRVDDLEQFAIGLCHKNR